MKVIILLHQCFDRFNLHLYFYILSLKTKYHKLIPCWKHNVGNDENIEQSTTEKEIENTGYMKNVTKGRGVVA